MAKRPETGEDLQSLVLEYRVLQSLSADLQQRATLLSSILSELQAAANTIEQVEKEGDEAEVLIPIGGASYIRAKLAHRGRAVVGLGAGVAVERELGEARRFLESRMGEVNQALSSVQSQLMNIAARMSQLEPKIREALEARKES